MTKIYTCPECGWSGPQEEMQASYFNDLGGAEWCETICPSCLTWMDLSEYEDVTDL
jgi:hypothetical protein